MTNRPPEQEQLDDIDTMSETTTDMIQLSASRVGKAINKPLKSRILSPPQVQERTSVKTAKRPYENDHGIKKQKLGQDRPISHFDKQGREIHDQRS